MPTCVRGLLRCCIGTMHAHALAHPYVQVETSVNFANPCIIEIRNLPQQPLSEGYSSACNAALRWKDNCSLPVITSNASACFLVGQGNPKPSPFTCPIKRLGSPSFPAAALLLGVSALSRSSRLWQPVSLVTLGCGLHLFNCTTTRRLRYGQVPSACSTPLHLTCYADYAGRV